MDGWMIDGWMDGQANGQKFDSAIYSLLSPFHSKRLSAKAQLLTVSFKFKDKKREGARVFCSFTFRTWMLKRQKLKLLGRKHTLV